MNRVETLQPTSEERALAALCHFFGVLAALIVWATQKDKPRFLRFQSLQAMAFDAVFLIVFMALMMCVMGIQVIGLLGLAFSAARSTDSPERLVLIGVGSMLLPLVMSFCIMPVSLAALIVRTIAAISVARGQDFRYPLIADRVDAFSARFGVR